MFSLVTQNFNEITTNPVLVLEHPHGKGVKEQQLYTTMLLIRLRAKQNHCWKNRIYCSFSIKSIEKKQAEAKSVMACNRWYHLGRRRAVALTACPPARAVPLLAPY